MTLNKQENNNNEHAYYQSHIINVWKGTHISLIIGMSQDRTQQFKISPGILIIWIIKSYNKQV